MKFSKELTVLCTVVAMTLIGCNNVDESEKLTLNINGLENLGSNYAYEGWLIVGGEPVSTGTFKVGTDGQLSQKKFTVDAGILDDASKFVLTIEPSPDSDPSPSATHIVAGDFNDGRMAQLSTLNGAALGTDFSDATGTFILATPTDDMNTNENSGVWWIDPSSGSPEAGLMLPALPSGWKYEGWSVIDGKPLSTGKFTSASGADDNAPFSGDIAGPPFPGEDFLRNAPMDVNLPTDLAGKTVVISVEPDPDNSPTPFLLKPLVAQVANDSQDHTPYGMNNNASNSNPTGSATR